MTAAAASTRLPLPEQRIDSLADEWDDLVDRVAGEPWHRPGWFRAYWRAFGRGELRVLSVRGGGRLSGILPLHRDRGGWRAPTNWHTPTFGILAEDEDARAELLERAFALRPASLAIAFLDPVEAPAFRAAANRRRYRTIERTYVHSPYVPTRGAIEDLWSIVDVRKSPRELSRRERKLAKEGEVEFVVDDGSTGLEDTLAEGLPVESSGWKLQGGTAIVSRPDTFQFYTEMPRWAAERGELRLFFYRFNGEMVSFEMCLEANNRLDNIKGGIHPEFRKFAVGVLTQYQMLKYCFAHGLDSFEFLGGEAVHKRDWTDVVRPRSLVQAFRPDPVGLTAYAAQAYGRQAAKRALALLRR